ncbi:FAD-dependent monooxygenase [Chelativorans sp. ZYF759]|uniref:FAD-dependent monooxygenase n=1 Tax=Chelativorans sp. ZYF759 TaxID=2692213 RepID=UPI001FEE6719|nr:FAD-dependent monooxygenase [Chelativorans sp. ZYF759]
MSGASSSDILIAGAGIAGLTAALAFAERGFCVRVFERAPLLVEVGAGLQLSPNATRLLDRLGLGEALRERAVRPQAVVLRRAETGRQVARVPLGEAALKRWGADYLVMHRADLQSVLGAAAHAHPAIRLYFGHDLCGARERPGAVMADMEVDGRAVSAEGRLLVGADGVWSRLRAGMDGAPCRAVGHTAWRTIIPGDALAAGALEPGVVTAFLAKRFHLVAYPLRGGREWNLVAITPDRAVGAVEGEWASAADPTRLRETLADAGPLLRGLADAAREWTAWPLVEVVGDTPWHVGRQVLIGDAAHAMTPHAAQGAGMAIEDACVLAAQMAAGGEDVERALARYETRRRPRVERVRRRGRFNRFVWHAWGPIALGRDLALAARPQGALAADFDWLYGWRPEET